LREVAFRVGESRLRAAGLWLLSLAVADRLHATDPRIYIWNR